MDVYIMCLSTDFISEFLKVVQGDSVFVPETYRVLNLSDRLLKSVHLENFHFLCMNQ